MRFIGLSLAAAGLSSLLLSAVIVHAVTSPLVHEAKTGAVMSGWSTTVVRD